MVRSRSGEYFMLIVSTSPGRSSAAATPKPSM
jgi:hypothetical protein